MGSEAGVVGALGGTLTAVIHTDKLAGNRGLPLEGGLDVMGLALEIQVECADDNARVGCNRLMQTHEVSAIQGEDDPRFRGREIEYGMIGNA